MGTLPADIAQVWKRLEKLGWQLDQLELAGRPISGERNNVHFLRHAGEDFVLRLPGSPTQASKKTPADQTREMHNLTAAAVAGVTPTPLLADPLDGLLVLPFVPGKHPEPAKVTPEAAARIGRCLRKLHRDTEPFQQGTDILRRIRRRVGYVAKDTAAARRHAPGLPTMARAMDPLLATLERTTPPPTPCHGDLVPGNIIDNGDRVFLIDWETSTAGDPHQDIANVCLRAKLKVDTQTAIVDTYLQGEPTATAESARARILLWKAACALDKALTYWRNGMRSDNIDPRADGWTRRCSALLAAPGTRAAILFLDTLDG